MDDEIKGILEKFPFLTYGVHLETPYLGVVQNCDSQLLSMYVITDIQTEELRKLFLELGNEWWWESNRLIPINIFIKERFRPFRECLKHFARKEFVIEAGPAVSLQETIAKRVRKRQITLLQPRDE
jgi:hypothetical protein